MASSLLWRRRPGLWNKGLPQVRKTTRKKSQAQVLEDSSSEQEEELHMETVYIVPWVEDTPEVTIPKGAKFPIPLPPIDPCVTKDGELLGYVPALKFIDYNLGDSKTYP